MNFPMIAAYRLEFVLPEMDNVFIFSYFFFSLLFRVINNNLIQVDDDVPIDVALDRISLDLTAPRSSSAQQDILFADYSYKDKSPPTSSVIVG